MADGIDPAVLAAWAERRRARMHSPIARAIYAGLATRAQRGDAGFMDDAAAAAGEE